MGMDENPIHRQTSISKHAFFDLSHVSPLVFLYLLKECYSYGKSEILLLFISEFYEYASAIGHISVGPWLNRFFIVQSI